MMGLGLLALGTGFLLLGVGGTIWTGGFVIFHGAVTTGLMLLLIGWALRRKEQFEPWTKVWLMLIPIFLGLGRWVLWAFLVRP